ncbi:hypothetical protein BIFGAL_04147 [Bifidobacterium gallicum DSM 20093 = LMG 11596]|uniref:Uncharacterized protein n=1 Tax=Bifidobacterium gallicum DSM 20093 = LMG 11596 TaxID=561180 RepID=D1NWA0_9BIFI|nr:hypothetical protein BIFGAL_04147 [Bifidobacterium gallicum DSM 20093 = LMG 11596]
MPGYGGTRCDLISCLQKCRCAQSILDDLSAAEDDVWMVNPPSRYCNLHLLKLNRKTRALES